ncbi:uncharacterized protein LOC108672176 [Hyalella azteca]|uniref:Uncharacterized protein LOC108672176 n=1 Tax=Hyalella azteca TaxID=294128 RepID=A0A8B7NNL2_HYAAZ|nr:uncharacterized protein LOC108672176 [Hyalella azteca]XP_018015294.1 uncharacterized protein LOC108672176 [Hyalella azteca]
MAHVISISAGELSEELHETLTVIEAHEHVEHIIKEEPEHDYIVTVDPCENNSDYFMIEEVEEQYSAIVHPSIGDSKEEFLNRLKESSQCYLCADQSFQWSSRLHQHFVKTHIDHSTVLANKLILVCKLGCKKDSHYHCPHAECLFSCKHTHRLQMHFTLNHITDSDQVDAALKQVNHAAISLKIKEEPSEFEDASFVCDLDNKILSSIFGEEDEMPEVRPAKISETLEGVQDMYKNEMDEEGRSKFMELLQQPSEKLSVAHSSEELIQRLEPPYCYLCEDIDLKPKSRLYRHFKSVHLGHHIKLANFFVASCKLTCSQSPEEGNNANLSHYHCPYPGCEATVKAKHRMLTHFKKHLDYFHMGFKNNYLSPANKANPYSRLKKSLILKDLDFPPPKKRFEFHGVPFIAHASISSQGPAELFDRLCLPFCYLCHDRKVFYAMPRLERHFRMAHLNRAVDCGSCYLIQCGLDCLPGGSNSRHYHCPFCHYRDPRRCAYWIHLESHRREGYVAALVNKMKAEGTFKSEGGDTAGPSVNFILPEPEDAASNVQRENPPAVPWHERYRGLPVRKVPGINNGEEAVLAAARLPHCYLCNSDKDYISERRLLAHISRCHVKPAFWMDNIMVLLCKLFCGDQHQDAGHYHCLFCDFVARQKKRVNVHVARHFKMLHKRKDTAEYHLPEVMDDHRVPDAWIPEDNRDEIRHWEDSFNDYAVNTYSKSGRTNNNVLTERKKCLIYNHTRLKMDIEDKSLKYWVRFRGVKVISCEQLGLFNVLVLPLTSYVNDEENRAINVAPEAPLKNFELVLKSDDHEAEFYKYYRLIPTREEVFKILYQLHIMNGYHPPPKAMFAEIRRKYLYLPRQLVDKFVSMCPTCGVQYPDKSDNNTPDVTVRTADTVNLAALQVTVVDMSEHPDGRYQYVVECFDRCSRLTWLIPAARAVATDLAEAVIRSVLSVIGLPCFMVTNCGPDFLDKMLQEIDRRWHGSCENFIERSREASEVLPVLSSDDLMEALQELVSLQPSSWASALPHLQFRLNHTRGFQSQEQSPFELVMGRQRSRPNWQRFLNNNNNNSGGGAGGARRGAAAHVEEDDLTMDEDSQDS